MNTEVVINNVKYNLDVQSALSAGVLTRVPSRRPLKLSDIPNQSVFQYRTIHTDEWNTSVFYMVNNTSNTVEQAIGFKTSAHILYPAFFAPDDTSVVYRYLRTNGVKPEWVESVLE